MSKIGGPGSPRLPTDQPKTEEKKTGDGGGSGGQAAGPAGGLAPSKRVLSAGDVERLASQAGFVRTGGKKSGRPFDVGDGSQAPIPLPEDDLDPELTTDMSLGGLEVAEGQLLHHSAQLGRSRKRGDKSLLGLWRAIVAGDAEGGEGEGQEAAMEARSAAIAAMQGEQALPAEAMAHLARSVAEQFGVDLSGVPVGPQLMAASLLVAGQQSDVAMAQASASDAPPSLDAERLLSGAGRIIDEGRQAADDARSRADGMQRNLNLQRTFVPKR